MVTMIMERSTTCLSKLICILLALSMIPFALLGCSDEDSADTSAESGMETEETFQPIEFVSEGKSEFVIWIAEELYSNSELKEMLTKVNDSIKDKTGITLKIKSDSRYDEDDAGSPAILVGNTKFSESAALGLNTRNKDFGVTASGNKILLYGNGAEGCINALRYFYNKVIHAQQATNKTLSFIEEYIYSSEMSYGIKTAVFGGVELKDFTIVTPKNANILDTLLANYLVYYLEDNYGYTLTVTDDTQETENEILIGNTARSTLTAEKNSFAVALNDGKLQLAIDGMRGFEGLYEYINSTLLYSSKDKEYSYDTGFAYASAAKSSINDGSSLADSSLGDIRVMYYNVYWHGNGPDDVRHALQTEMIKSYAPDVICAQEYASYHHDGCTPLLEKLGYADASVTTAYVNNTPLFYRTDKLKLVSSGCWLYSQPNNGDSKSITWAVLEVKATGERFIAISTHMMYDQPGIDANAARIQNAKEMLSVISAIRSNAAFKDLPIIMGGDLNCRVGSEPQNILIDGGLKRAYDLATEKNNNSGHHAYPTWSTDVGMFTEWTPVSGVNTNAIDHAFVSEGVVVKAYATLTSLVPLWLSDHMPLIVDIDL